MNTKRIEYIDIARGIAIIAIILGHIGIGKLGVFLYTFHLPLFYIISGYLFSYTSEFKVFLKKKVKAYIVPYFSCSLIIILFNNIIRIIKFGSDYRFYTEELLNFIIQKRYTTLWFLSTIFIGLLIFWITFKITKQDLNRVIFLCCLFSCVFILYDEFVGKPIIWNIDTAFIIQIYLLLGYLLNKFDIIKRLIDNKYRWITILFIGSCICSGLNFFICGETYEMFRCRYGVFPLTITAAIMASVCVILISTSIKSIFLKWLGKNTMAIFAFHQSIAMVISTKIINYFFQYNINLYYEKIFLKVLMFCMVMIICIFMNWLIFKMKAEFILGK